MSGSSNVCVYYRYRVMSSLTLSEINVWSDKIWAYLQHEFVSLWPEEINLAVNQYWPFKMSDVLIQEFIAKHVYPVIDSGFSSIIDVVCHVPPAPRNMTVFRGVSAMQLQDGDILTNMTPFAVTTDIIIAEKYAGDVGMVLTIHVPAGFPCAYFGSSMPRMGCSMQRLQYMDAQKEIRMQPTLLLVNGVHGREVDCSVIPIELIMLKHGSSSLAPSWATEVYLTTSENMPVALQMVKNQAQFQFSQRLESYDFDDSDPAYMALKAKMIDRSLQTFSYALMQHGRFDRSQLIAAMGKNIKG